jgi:hypothetical protein
METRKDQDTITGQETNIDQALEDADRMLYFASKGKIDDKTDLDCLKELARIVVRIRNAKDRKAINEEDLAHFYSQLSIMSHILYPVTSESLKVMEGIFRHSHTEDKGKTTIWSCTKKITSAACSSRPLMFFMAIAFFITLLVTPWIFSYSMRGSDIISRLDATMKDRVTIKKELMEELKISCPESKINTQNPQEDGSEKNKNDTRKVGMLINRHVVKTAIFNSLINQLDQWNQSTPGSWIVSMYSNQEGGNKNQPKPQEVGDSEKRKQENSESGKYDNAEICQKAINDYMFEFNKYPQRMDGGLKIKNNGLLILQTINGTVLLLLFGFCGAASFIMKITIQALQAHTFTGIRCTTWLRILLGTFSGFFLGYLGGSNELMNLLTFDNEAPGGAPINISQVSSLTLAFIGGYSVDLLFSILNRFIYAVTNDDRYLPASERVRRKVDVSKFVDKEKLKQDKHKTQKDTRNIEAGAGPEPPEPIQGQHRPEA